jgi:molybdenum cofactor biosynthesis protein B
VLLNKKTGDIMSTKEHKKGAPKRLQISILSVSTSRTLSDDVSGLWIKKEARREGHEVLFHEVVPDEKDVISGTATDVIQKLNPHALLITGGSGISKKDVTIEAITPLFDKKLSAFAPLFAQLSYEQIDSAAIMSRATAGIVDNTAVFCMPGSLKACKLACRALIFPELGHITKHVYFG